MSGCAKFALIVTVLGALVLATCCIGGSIFLRQSLTTDVDRVQSIANAIVDCDIPRRFRPLVAMDIWIVRWASFASPDAELIMLGDSRLISPQVNERQMSARFRADMGGEKFEETEIVQSHPREFAIANQAVALSIHETRGEKTGHRYFEVAGMVPALQGPAFVYLRFRPPTGLLSESEEEIRSLLESIQ